MTKRAFSIARELGYVKENPVKIARLNSRERETVPFTQSEIDTMLADTAEHPSTRAVVFFMLHTGLRIGDVQTFPIKAVDLSASTIRLRTEKRSKTVTLGLHQAVRSALIAHLARFNGDQKASGLLFPTETGKVATSLDAYLKRMFERCKIENGHAHRFRDTFAVRLLAKGASLYDVAKLLGITVAVAERHYSPWVQELQDRASQLVRSLDFVEPGGTVVAQRNSAPTKSAA
jgi:integrase